MPIDTSELTAQQQATAVYVAYYDRAPDPAGLQFWTNQLQDGRSLEQVATDFSGAAETKAKFPFFDTPDVASAEAFIVSIYSNLFGRTPDEAGQEFWADQLASGSTPVGEIILKILEGAQDEASGGFPDSETVANKIDVGINWAQSAAEAGIGLSNNPIAEESDDGQLVINNQAAFDSATSVLNGVDGTEESVTDASAAIDEFISTGGSADADLTLTQLADDLQGTGDDDVFSAPVTQNETGSGAVANTFETGDVLDGGEGTDVLNASLTSSFSGGQAFAPAISATTESIEVVNLRAQFPNQADVTIDAEQMNGVEQWWSDNSRSNILVEDIRSNPADTAFGMRETDPGVNFASFINANFLEGGTAVGESAFNFTIQEANALGNELNDITVNGVRFALNGENFELGGADVEAANTWAELETALQASIDGTEGLDGLSVEHQGNGQFVVTDPAAGDFDIDPAGTVITSSTTNEVKDASEGQPEVTDLPTETDIFLDNAGNGSQGGAMDVGVMSGDRGVEVFNTTVLSDSHITGLQSSNFRTPDQYLEEVLVEGEGDLTLGNTDNTFEGRAINGLFNVRVLDASALNGSLNAGIVLNNNAVGRYLDEADEAVNFEYTGTANDDVLSINADNNITGDPDFAMQVDTGAGDDVIHLTNNNSVLSAVSLDGGDGEDTLETSSDIGVDEDSTPADFANIENLVLTGQNTDADMEPLTGVESVSIATGGSGFGGGDSTVSNLEADASLTITGERQTQENFSNADQNFGVITLTDAQSTSQLINIDNTARVDGELTVGGLTVDGDNNAVREITLNSGGSRQTTNVVNNINAALATGLIFTGTQALAAEVDLIGQDADGDGVAFDISGANLEGDLDLTLNENNVSFSNANDEAVTLTGTAGDNDTLTLDDGGDADITSDTTVTDFETVVLGTEAPFSSFGGDVDTSNFSGVDLFYLQNLGAATTLTDLGNDVNVDLSDFQADNDAITLAGSGGGTINIQLVNVGDEDDDPALASDDLDWDNAPLDVSGFANVNLALDNAEGFNETTVLGLGLDGKEDNALLGTPLVLTGDAANYQGISWVVDDVVDDLTITGGNASDDDGLVLFDQLPASTSTIDASGFEGAFTATLGNAVVEDPNNAANANAANTDTRFVLNENDADITLTALTTEFDNVAPTNGDALSVDFNTIFEFTDAPGAQDGGNPAATWTIDNFVAEGFDNATNDNFSILDLSDLGIGSFAELDTIDQGNDTVITEEGGDSTWEIILTGVNGADLAPSENFIFA